jgi:hypothetical protein
MREDDDVVVMALFSPTTKQLFLFTLSLGRQSIRIERHSHRVTHFLYPLTQLYPPQRIQQHRRSSMRLQSSFTISIFLLVGDATAFAPQRTANTSPSTKIPLFSSIPSDVSTTPSLTLADMKADLVRACTKEDKPGLSEIKTLVRDLEDKAEMVGVGQVSSISGLMAGEWYVRTNKKSGIEVGRLHSFGGQSLFVKIKLKDNNN